MVTTLDSLTDEVLMYLNGYGLVQPRSTWLTSSIDDTTVQIPVTSVDNFGAGLAEVGNELIYVSSVDNENGFVNVPPDGRGYYSTVAAPHEPGERMVSSPTWPRVQVKRAINDTILGIWPDIYGVASTTFLFSPAVSTYGIDTDAERVLAVSYDTIGPSRTWERLSRYTFDPTANELEYPTGNSLTLLEGVPPGRTVQVVYGKRPTTLADGDALSVSGLQESARMALIYGACSQLVSYMDSAQLFIHSAEADEYDADRQAGAAARLATQLYARYAEEISRERRRLQTAHPPTVTYSKGR